MQGGDVSYWLLWVGGITGLIACLAVTWWGLFGDSAKGRRRCPWCWYDLSHSPGTTCPECGRTPRNEKQLFRTRRRWLPAIVSAFAAALGTTWAIELAQQRGWVSMMPTTGIVMVIPLVGDAHGALSAELTRRMRQRKLTDGQWRMVIKRCIKGDRTARPVTEGWEDKYGTLLDQARGILPAEYQLDRLMLELPPTVKLGVPITARVLKRDFRLRDVRCLDETYLTAAGQVSEFATCQHPAGPEALELSVLLSHG